LSIRDAQLEDILADPHKYGLPTFSEFCKNKAKWMPDPMAEINSVDRGDPMLGCFQKYFVEDKRGKRFGPLPLEMIEAISLDMGLSLEHDFIKDPQLRPNGAGGFFNEVTFRPNPMAIKRVNT
jgi:hypothetical protein